MGRGQAVGDGRVGEAMVATGASMMGGGMFLIGMSSSETWSVMSLVS